MSDFASENAIFLHIPKCAGMSMELFCIQNRMKIAPLNRSQQWCDAVNGDRHPKTGWSVPAQTYGVSNEEIVSGSYFTFAFVRNPWDRMVSAWKSTNVSRQYFDKSFSEFLKFIFSDEPNQLRASHVRSYFHPSYMIFDQNDQQIVHFIGRFEQLQKDFDLVCSEIEVQTSNLLHLNRSDRAHYSQYYNGETKRMIENQFKKDIEYFEYCF